MGRPGSIFPVDWILRVPGRTNAVIAAAVGAEALYIVAAHGLDTFLVEGWHPCAVIGGGLYVLARWLRKTRGIELADTEHTK